MILVSWKRHGLLHSKLTYLINGTVPIEFLAIKYNEMTKELYRPKVRSCRTSPGNSSTVPALPWLPEEAEGTLPYSLQI